MNWETERYVRFYVRDQVEWLSLSFEAQGLLGLLLRKCDRAGLIKLGKHGKKGVATLIGHPHRAETIEPALEALLADGVFAIRGEHLVCRNFVAAQEARQTDAARQRTSRERLRDLALAAEVLGQPAEPVTNRDNSSQSVTKCHTPSHGVTPSLAVPSQPSQPSRAIQTGEDGRGGKAGDLQALWNDLAAPCLPRWCDMTADRSKKAATRLSERSLLGPDGWRAVIERINASPFCLGDGPKGWRASPDWLLKPGTAAKVLEGNYDNHGKPADQTDEPTCKTPEQILAEFEAKRGSR